MPKNRIVRRKRRIETQFYQTDMAGVIHNSEYLRWFEEGRLEIMWEIMSLEEAMARKVMVPVIHVHCDYKNYVRYRDPLILYTEHEMKDPYEGRLVFDHTLIHARTKRDMATGQTIVAIVNLETGLLVKKWPDDLWQRYLALS